MSERKGVKLHIIISLLILFIIVSTVSINWFISTNMQKESLTDNYLKNNHNYAKKVASSTEYQLHYMKQNMISISDFAKKYTINQNDVDMWYKRNKDQFNVLFTTDNQGVVQLLSPDSMRVRNNLSSGRILRGTRLESTTIKQALINKEPLISEPYLGTDGKLVSLISAPMFDSSDKFTGVVGGIISMESENVLSSIIGEHEFDNDSYVYVVDQEGTLIYHPEIDRIGEDVSSNEIVQQLVNQESGSDTITNTQGKEFIAGYAHVKNTGWGIVAQTPTSVTRQPLSDLFWRTVMLSIPFLIVILIIGGLIVSMITRPIHQLAKFSERAEVSGSQDVEILNIRSPIYEVRQLYYQGIKHLRMLNKQAKMDGLTEIANRRTFDGVFEIWLQERVPFSLIMIDIDHFKDVNDQHGHLIGDEVIKYVTRKMVDVTGQNDLCFRYGGEEFGILIKNKNEEEAYHLAEELRSMIANTKSPSGSRITISLGLTAYQRKDEHSKDILNRADEALYHSKQTGRNKTTVF